MTTLLDHRSDELAPDLSGQRLRVGARVAVGALLGIVLSGPLALVIANATHPQPAWQDAAAFARSYHPIQLLPFAGGLLLVASLVVLMTCVHALAPAASKLRASVGQVFVLLFAAFIFFNYVVQSTYLPGLVGGVVDVDKERATVITTLSMANPSSLAWAIEMWGYAFLGIAPPG